MTIRNIRHVLDEYRDAQGILHIRTRLIDQFGIEAGPGEAEAGFEALTMTGICFKSRVGFAAREIHDRGLPRYGRIVAIDDHYVEISDERTEVEIARYFENMPAPARTGRFQVTRADFLRLYQLD